MDRTLAIFGISGGTGRAVARAATARGWRVRGLARGERPVGLEPPDAAIVRGDLDDPGRVAETLAGASAACCVIGPRPPYTDVFCAAATEAIVAAMHAAGIRRLICQTGAMVGPAPNRSWLFERMARAYARRQPAAAEDRVAQERVVAASGLEWTIVKPPRLTDGRARNVIEAGPVLRVGLLSTIARADLAAFILDELDAPRWKGARVFVTG